MAKRLGAKSGTAQADRIAPRALPHDEEPQATERLSEEYLAAAFPEAMSFTCFIAANTAVWSSRPCSVLILARICQQGDSAGAAQPSGGQTEYKLQ